MEGKKNIFLIKSYKQMFMVIGIFTLILLVGGTTYAFFNYTRTGSANTVKVGRISFNHTQDSTITLTNIFPMSSEEIANDTNPANNITINIEGDTTYSGGIEYLVTAEDVNITVGDKKLPLNLYVSSTTDLGDNDSDYFTNRGGNTSIHKVLSGGVVVDGQYLVVGYIAPGETKVDGSLNIKAYIDSSKIKISDTYDGTESDNMGTTNEWVGDKTVFTTSEWNSLSGSSNSLSFKIRVEANEGIWVEEATTPNLMNTIGISRSANIKEIRFIEETPLRMQRRYDASVGSESDNTKLDLTYQDTGKVLAWIEPITVNPTGASNENLNIKPSFLVNENSENNLKQIDNETSYILYIASSGKTKLVTGSNLFNGFTSVEKITFENVDSSDVTDMSGMFYNLSSLKDIIGLNKLNTSNVLYMDNMFYGNSSLTSIDLSGMGSDNLVAIGGMFYNCNNLKTIIMKNFNFGAMNFYNSPHGGYTNYYYAFSNLPNVETIDLTNANTSGVTNMYEMFYYCKKLKNIIGLNTLDMSNVTDMRYMFSESGIETINLSGVDMSSVTTMYDMFYNCKSLTSVNMSNVDARNVSNMVSMFSDCILLSDINLNNMNTSNIQEIYFMFKNCTSLTSIDLSGLGGSNLAVTYDLFYNCNNLKSINMSNFNFGIVNFYNNSNYNHFFANLPNVETINLTNANTSNVTSMYDMFYSCTKLKNIIGLNTLDTSNVTDMRYMFGNCSSLASLDLSNFNTSKVTTMNSMFYSCDNLENVIIHGNGNGNLQDTGSMFSNCSELVSIDLSGLGGDNLSTASDMFYNCSSLKNINMSNFNFGTLNVAGAYGIFDNLRSVLETINLSGANFSSPNRSSTNFSEMFRAFAKLKSVDLSNADTSKVTNMYHMFYFCSELENVKFDGIDTSKVTDMQMMFSECYKLTSLDLSSFDTSSVTTVYYMFADCRLLQTIYVSNNWNVSNVTVTYSNSMFSECTSLVGGNGTVYDSSKIDKTMAVIDTPSTPGYLTMKQV